MEEVMRDVVNDKVSRPKLMLESEMAISVKREKQVWDLIDQVTHMTMGMVNTRLKAEEVLPGPIRLQSKAATVFKQAQSTSYPTDRAISMMAPAALAASEENAPGHIIATAPTGGSAGVVAVLVKGHRNFRKVTPPALQDASLASAVSGHLCKHNATLSVAEGWCQTDIGLASATAPSTAMQTKGAGIQVISNGAESALESYPGKTCGPVAGFLQVPCIQRCAFRALKAATLGNIERADVLPFHQVDRYKWKDLGMNYALQDLQSPSSAALGKARAQFRSAELKAYCLELVTHYSVSLHLNSLYAHLYSISLRSQLCRQEENL